MDSFVYGGRCVDCKASFFQSVCDKDSGIVIERQYLPSKRTSIESALGNLLISSIDFSGTGPQIAPNKILWKIVTYDTLSAFESKYVISTIYYQFNISRENTVNI